MRRVMARYFTPEMALLGLIEFVLSFTAIYAVIALPGSLPGQLITVPHDSLALATMLSLVTAATGLAIGLYRTDICLDRRRLVATTGIAAIVAFVILMVLSGPHSGFSAAHALFIAKLLGAWLATLALIRLIHGTTTRRTKLARRILLVGDPRHTVAFDIHLRSRGERGFHPVIPQGGELSWPRLREDRIWGIVVASEPEEAMLRPLLDCKFRGMRILSAAAFHENYLGRIDLDLISATDLLMTHGFDANRAAAAVRRLSDIALGLAMLSMTLPLMVLTAIAIKIDSKGPALYRQTRVGQFGRPFSLFKFRSMITDAEACGSPRWAQRQDPRITRIGRFIRSARIDELPQLVNVIRGDMSLVGPRPERPHFVEQLTRAIPLYPRRSYVKPGVTGWAQVNFPYGASVEDAREKLAYDLYYVKNRSLLLDAIILLSTVRVVLFREGAR